MGLRSFFSREKKVKNRVDAPLNKWSIGIYTGQSIFSLTDPGPDINPVLTVEDIAGEEALLVADPFMIKHRGNWFLFFETEVKTARGSIGKIGMATSEDGLHWKFKGIVLEEPFHLSYPYVFEYANEIYMIPETRSVRSIRLYRAIKFPYEWQFEKELLKGRRFADNSLFEFNGLWWLFTDSGNHTLRLYYSDHPLGKWKGHRKSPILRKDEHFARPGGRVVVIDGVPVRFSQDAYPHYGSRVWGFRINRLDPRVYEEIPIPEPILIGAGKGWNGRGMHTIDPHMKGQNKIIACVDGLE